jgi:hypothetical protein
LGIELPIVPRIIGGRWIDVINFLQSDGFEFLPEVNQPKKTALRSVVLYEYKGRHNKEDNEEPGDSQ